MNNNIYQQPSIQPENNPNIQNNSMSNQLNNKPIFNNKKLFIIVGIVLVIAVGIFIALNINKDKINKGIILSQGGYKCKRANVSTLHTETCTYDHPSYYCSGEGYRTSGSKGTTTITYGNKTTTKGTLTSGDAFDCDINGDGTYSPETERFYYISDLYDTTNQTYNSDVAVLIYYNNTTKGVADNKASSLVAYNSNDRNYEGPKTAKINLPTTTQWQNVNLVNVKRQVLTTKGATSTYGGSLTVYDYSGYAARLITAQELNKACDITVAEYIPSDELEKCNYLFENTKYSNSSMGTNGYWLETPHEGYSSHVWQITGITTSFYINNAKFTSGVRPVIEVKKTDIEY